MPIKITRDGCTPRCTCSELEKRKQLQECASFEEEWRLNDYYNIMVSRHPVLCNLFDEIHMLYDGDNEDEKENRDATETTLRYKTTEVLIIRGPWVRNRYFLFRFSNSDKWGLEKVVEKKIIEAGGYERLNSILAKEAPPLKSYAPKMDRIYGEEPVRTHQIANLRIASVRSDRLLGKNPPAVLMTGTNDIVNYPFWDIWVHMYEELKRRGEPPTAWQMRRLLIQTNMRVRSTLEEIPYEDQPYKIYRFFSHCNFDVNMNKDVRLNFSGIYSCGLGIYSKVWNVIPCGSKFEDSVKEVEEEVDTGADIVKVANTLMDDEGITETLEPPVMDDERLTRHRRTPTKSGESTYASRTLFKNSSNTRSSLTF
ncbi:hypothetical protein NCAS_0F03700 [Naumovozyma castellii]|uniref:Uncharacterized protein n=1 Tax=Naumovozyma castellii TaxID=27288 RepID=G0VH81_NAUCA|nr:hypothetical protein NCAS_0F03700 [Naumovozyma castellii CBS 4309]CCC70854.1 hypothetical protein NCAS_0F03700 [Naumovozyma castellii CBS 4309]